MSGTARDLSSVTVTMSNWALQSTPANIAFCEAVSGNCDSTGFNWPITVNIYSNHLDSNGVPDVLLGTKTVATHIPWRPEADATCTPSTAWRASDSQCYSGIAFNASFDLSDLGVTLPDDVIVGFAYNTQSYGSAPTGIDGPYNSLNIAVPPSDPVTIGTDDSADKVFWDSTYSGRTTGFKEDSDWMPYGTVALRIQATEPEVAACPADTTQSASPIETVTVNAASSAPIASLTSLANGLKYLLVSSGTWRNGGLNVTDTEYASVDDWITHMNGYDIAPYFLGEGEFDLKINNIFVNWGSYNPSHIYKQLYTGTGTPLSLGIFDGDSNTGTVNEGWYGDNSGNLSVAIYSCDPNVPPATVPTNMNQCKNDGWKTFSNPSFKNQGQCVSYVQANEHAKKH